MESHALYTLIGSTLPDLTRFSAGTIPQPSFSAVDILVLNFEASLAPGTYSLEYQIQLIASGASFGPVSSDTSGGWWGQGSTTLTTNIFDRQGNPVGVAFTSLGGAPGGPSPLPPGMTFLDVQQTIVVPTGGVLVQAANAYTELITPPTTNPVTSLTNDPGVSVLQVIQVTEPASLILLGIGLLGMGFLLRKIAV